jgi:hypothetical protein
LTVGLAGIGLVLTGTPALVRLLSSLLYEVHAFDPKTFLTASVWLMGVVLAACYILASRAARLDSMTRCAGNENPVRRVFSFKSFL